MYGQIFTELGRHALADRLSKSGLRARVGESSHYEGGEYVQIYADDEVDFRLERMVSGEYLVHADPASVEQISHVASIISGTLTALDVRHRFEVYDARSQMTDYFQHLWPLAAND